MTTTEQDMRRMEAESLRDLVNSAIALAADAHAGQVDKAGVNYILHPMRVMLQFSDPTYQIVAILHDVVEDTTITLDDLRTADVSGVEFGFPDEVVDAVDALTRREGERYGAYLLRAAANPIARAVKVADIKDNLSRITPELDGLRRRYEHAMIALSWAGRTGPTAESSLRDAAQAADEAWVGRRDRELQSGATS